MKKTVMIILCALLSVYVPSQTGMNVLPQAWTNVPSQTGANAASQTGMNAQSGIEFCPADGKEAGEDENLRIRAEAVGNIFSNVRTTERVLPLENRAAESGEVRITDDYIFLDYSSAETYRLTAVISPESMADTPLTWESRDTNVAEVDSDGVVTAKGIGITQVTVKGEGVSEAKCEIYVMGFDVSVPACCTLDEIYEININIYNNGFGGDLGRKRVILDTEGSVELTRVGDSSTRYTVLAEASRDYNAGFTRLDDMGYFIDTQESVTVYYRLMPDVPIERAGDYKGSVTFSVSVL